MSGSATKRMAGSVGRSVTRIHARVVAGPDEGRTATADVDRPLTIGVAEGTSLQLRDRAVSRYHLEVSADERGMRLKDLKSLNGTFYHGARVLEAVIQPGAVVRVGTTEIELTDVPATEEVVSDEPPDIGMVVASEAMRKVAREVATLAPHEISVLIHGETGTGKEVLARALHALSPRASAPFEIVDCGSLPPRLVASQLFGHERGAFTGADRRHPGAFERADGGTLFLDEVGELPLDVQPVLLGALERKSFLRVGGSQPVEVDVRVLAATHRDLREGVNDGSFRADLFYRLAVATLHVPPLRQRREEIPALVQHFVEQMTGEPGRLPFGEEAMQRMLDHPWSGNVRELRNVVESALAVGGLRLPPSMPERSGRPADRRKPYREARAEAIQRFEHEYLSELIEGCSGNASEAARQAKMDRPYLLTLLRKHGLR